MPEPIISISGLRGIVGSELTPETAIKYAAAFCQVAPAGPIVVSRDGRASGPMLLDAISATISASGRDCLDLDVASTPTAGFFVKSSKAAGGIQISASHNPPPYNGMKLFSPEGRVIGAEAGGQVLGRYREAAFEWVPVESLGKRVRIELPYEPHLAAVLATVDADLIRRAAFKVLLDSNHGAGSLMGRTLLEKLGCTVEILGATPDGQFSHPPEPLSENLVQVAALVRDGGYAVGFCQDPDADRLALIDGNGRYIGEEYTSVFCALNRLKRLAGKQSSGALVTNCASSSMMKRIAEQFGVPFHQSAVGEANVADMMVKTGALYGGEGSGGPIDPSVGLIRDSFVGMAQVLELMARETMSVAEVVASLPQSAMIKDKMSMSKETLLKSIDRLKDGLQAESLSLLDGVRLDWKDRWLLLRGSNTEPIVRLIAEAPTNLEAQDLIARAKSLIGAS
ncbi:MAG: phosphoglucosamine mutase [Pirellula sp.]|nr:phosphoglucosamine mutase [Pirellula sp.]